MNSVLAFSRTVTGRAFTLHSRRIIGQIDQCFNGMPVVLSLAVRAPQPVC